MKFRNHFAQVLILLCAIVLAAASSAATHPLNQPMGMAVDAKGNLYVANHGGNQILVYNSSSQQMTSKTIASNINGPMQLAFDPLGNLLVANLVSGSTSREYFSEYAPNGKQITTGYSGGGPFAVPALPSME